ncbi:MAG: ROK family protein [Prolixibacteraceae bacterium]
MAVIGIDLGGTKISAALFRTNGRMEGFRKVLLQNRKGKEVGELVRAQLRSLIREKGRGTDPVTSVGVSVPGIFNRNTGRVWVPNIEGWKDYPLMDELTEAVKDEPVTVSIADDRSCYIMGETWKGKATDCKNAIFLAVGTGICAGILIDGKVLHGAGGIAGSIGWLALSKLYEEKYIPCGCNEYYASGEGLTRYAGEVMACSPGYEGVFLQEEVSAYNLIREYGNNDEIAVKVIRNAIEYWGMTVANLVSIFNPEKIIFGGGVFGEAVRFLDQIYAEAKKWGQPVAMEQVTLEASETGAMAGLYGAAYLAMNPY